MEIGAAEYRAAAEEHLAAAAQCHVAGLHLTAHCLSGLAVECILRAYRWRLDDSWDGRHVLVRLYKAAQYDRIVPRASVEEATAKFGVIVDRWSNDHRYASPAKLLRRLNALDALRNAKGDKLKRNSREMYDAAAFIVELGLERWKS